MHVSLPASVTVSAAARLHLGFLDPSGGLGRRFGSIGLAVDGFTTRLTIRPARSTTVTGPEHDRVQRHIETLRPLFGRDQHYEVIVRQAAPAHVGLGSGTQIALAVAAGMRQLHGEPLDIRGDAGLLGRGARSGIGIGLFEQGGLVVDGGRGETTKIPPIITRLPFPEDWCIVVVLDPSRQGVHGADEGTAFAELPPFPDTVAAELCRLVVMQALPSLVEHDLENFGRAIKAVQRRLGDYFALAQGGRFTSPDVAAALDHLEHEGCVGIGQSSWGPTGFAFASSVAEARRIISRIRQHPDCRELDFQACAGLNRGAEIATDEPAVEAQQEKARAGRR